MKELIDHRYVDGVTVFGAWGPDLIVRFSNPVVTMEGVEFLQENSKMQKALNYLKEAKSALPFT